MNPRLFLQIASVEARRRMSYRVDFWLSSLVGFVAEFGVAYFVWKALFTESGKTVMEGYTFDAMLFYYVVVLLFGKLVRGVEFDNHVSQDIYEGGLNRYLVFPTSYIAFKYAQQIGSLVPAWLQLVLFGGICLVLLDLGGDVDVTPLGALLCLASLVVANLLYYLMSFPLQATAFWADNVWSLMVALRFVTALLGGMMIPLALFPDWLRAANGWLPFQCLFSVPVEALMGRIGFAEWLSATSVAGVWMLVLAAVNLVIWRRGNLQYSGVGI